VRDAAPEIVIYHLCRTFGCTPSQLENEDPKMMAVLSHIDYVVESKVAAEMKHARD